MQKDFLDLNIFWSPAIGKKQFEGRVAAISCQNNLGNFDVLPGHINFITLIFKKITVHLLNKEKISYDFSRGVLEVSENKVNVFLGF